MEREVSAVAQLVDKLILLACCAAALPANASTVAFVSALLAAVTLSALGSFLPQRWSCVPCLIYLAGCLAWTELIYFLPLIAYDAMGFESKALRLVWLIPLAFRLWGAFERQLLVELALICLAAVLSVRTQGALAGREQYFRFQDEAREAAMGLERQNRQLMEKQDYEVRLATLNERNRIAREIHDNVGHALTRCLLQVGALQVINRDQAVGQSLAAVKDSLSQAMDDIRRSVHGLHDDSVDLRVQLTALISGFDFCPVRLEYEAGEIAKPVQYCFTAIAREALNNVARHSDATNVSIHVREHPALYQLIIEDNGARPPVAGGRGMGLDSMRDRVRALDGAFLAEWNKGFRVFASVPKEVHSK